MWYRLDGEAATDAEANDLWRDYRRWVGETLIGRGVRVSTVFTIQDKRFTLFHTFELPGVAPILWETKVFGGVLDSTTVHYATREEAEAGHNVAVRAVEISEGLEPSTRNALAPILCDECGEGFRGGERILPRPGGAVHIDCEMLGIIGHTWGVCGCHGFKHDRAAARELRRRIEANL